MTIAVAGNRSAVGVAVAEVNLKLIWEVISAIKVGRTGDAFVLDGPGRLIAHPDISLVLRADEAGQRPLQALRGAILDRPGEAATGRDVAGETVLAAMAPIPGVDWSVIVKQPLAEAFGPIYAALWRTAVLLVGGAAAGRRAGLVAGPAHDRARSACWRTASSASAPGSSTTASSSRPATSSSGWPPASTRWQPSWRSRRSARSASTG